MNDRNRAVSLTQEDVNTCSSLAQVTRMMGYHENRKGYDKARIAIGNLNTDHFGPKRIYPLLAKQCPVCNASFTVRKGAPREKITCSHACSNTYFRSGNQNPNWKESAYRTTCFMYHPKQCIVCGEDKIVEVHHLDENSENNVPENLVPLCPTHHQYCHSRHKHLVEAVVLAYMNNFASNRSE